MNTYDHYLLAKNIADNLNDFGGHFKRFLFFAGSVAPDINFFTYIKGHMFSDRRQFLNHLLKSGEKSVCNTGILIHYVADCFTFAHNNNFSCSMNSHRDYENALHDFIKNDFTKFAGKISIPYSLTLPELFNNLHDQYLNNQHSYENDCIYIYNICFEFTKRLLRNYNKNSALNVPVHSKYQQDN